MNFDTVTIVGTGLIGGSIGLGLKKRRLAKHIIGVGRQESTINLALKIKAIDEGAIDFKKALNEADIVILATSVDTILKLAKKAIPLMKKSAILTDVGSTKNYIVSEIDKEINEKHHGNNINFVGAHPLAGSEQRGIDAAKADLFENSICVLTPSKTTSKSCITKVSKMWKALGAEICILQPLEHDEIVASVSHLPHFVAAGLTCMINKKYWKFAASGLRDTTRVASGDPKLWLNICKQNRAKIIEALKRFSREINSTLNDLEKENDKSILKKLTDAKNMRDKFF